MDAANTQRFFAARPPKWAHELWHALEHIDNLIHRILNAMAQLDDKVTELSADVAATRGVVDSAVALLNGIGQMISDAVAAALAAGATPEQLQAITDVDTAVKSQSADLAAAVAANTPTP